MGVSNPVSSNFKTQFPVIPSQKVSNPASRKSPVGPLREIWNMSSLLFFMNFAINCKIDKNNSGDISQITLTAMWLLIQIRWYAVFHCGEIKSCHFHPAYQTLHRRPLLNHLYCVCLLTIFYDGIHGHIRKNYRPRHNQEAMIFTYTLMHTPRLTKKR